MVLAYTSCTPQPSIVPEKVKALPLTVVFSERLENFKAQFIGNIFLVRKKLSEPEYYFVGEELKGRLIASLTTSFEKVRVVREGQVLFPSSVNIDILLKRCAAYCERLQKAVLDYVCQEEITEELIYESRTRGFRARELVFLHQTNHYLYDYQLIRKGKDFIEKRVLREENGQRRRVENASL